jgi:hypothetical protein
MVVLPRMRTTTTTTDARDSCHDNCPSRSTDFARHRLSRGPIRYTEDCTDICEMMQVTQMGELPTLCDLCFLESFERWDRIRLRIPRES